MRKFAAWILERFRSVLRNGCFDMGAATAMLFRSQAAVRPAGLFNRSFAATIMNGCFFNVSATAVPHCRQAALRPLRKCRCERPIADIGSGRSAICAYLRSGRSIG